MNFLLLIIFYFFSLNLFSNERYICNHKNQDSIKLITNFYVMDKKLVMSGAVGNGTYNILNTSENGLLAVNSSFIGEEFGLETILINKKNRSFKYKTFINREKDNSIVAIEGICSLAN